MTRPIDICPSCNVRAELGVDVRGHYVGREIIGAAREKRHRYIRVAYACDFGHTWNHKLRADDPRIPPATVPVEDERGVLNPRPAPGKSGGVG